MIDIVFSWDTTGSQFSILHELRRKLEQTVNHLFEIPDLRIGMIAHGDYNDSPYSIKTLPLTDNRNDLINFVRRAEQTNGFGNGGEQYENVIHQAKHFNWRENSKRAFVMLGDEPAHNKGDRYYPARSNGNDPTIVTIFLDWVEEAKALNDLGITSYMVRCQNRPDSRHFHNSLSKIWNTPLLSLHQFSDIEPLLFALTYKQDSDIRLETYSTELESAGKLNRNLATIIDQLLGKTTIHVDAEFNRIGNSLYPKKSKFNIPDGLIPVEPTRFQILHVDHNTDIKSFVLSTGARFKKGMGFYELTKPETVQETKEIVLRDKISGDMFTGKDARMTLGIPYGERGTVKPSHGFKYDVFIQSTSVNRKLLGNTRFLYEAEMY